MKKKKLIIAFFVFLTTSLMFSVVPSELEAKTLFVIIGSGDFNGVYFPTGLAIAKIINDKRKEYEIRATVASTRGSVFNVNAVMAGYMDFGLVQSDKQYQAVNGLAEWAEKGSQKELRSVFSIHHESVNLVAAVDAGIKTIVDLKGKRVNLGNRGSGQYLNSIDALEAVGLNYKGDIFSKTVKASEAPYLLLDNHIDAFFCTVGHPSETLQTATSGARKVSFIPIAGPSIDKMIADKHYYTSTTVPVAKFYPGAEGPVDIKTFGVIATLCTSSKVPVNVVYTIIKEVFDNFGEFKKQHPAFATLKKESMLTGLTSPFHPGAIKYLKEVGLMK